MLKITLIGFQYDESQKNVQCIPYSRIHPHLYAEKWIQYKSRNSHLQSADHQDAVQLLQMQEARRQQFWKEHDQLVQKQLTENLQIPRISKPLKPIPAHDSSAPPNPDFWAMSDEDFIMDPPDDPETHLKQELARAFSSWDSEIGQEFLGEGIAGLNINDVMAFHDDEVDLLDIMGNADVANEDLTYEHSDEWFPYPSCTMFLFDTIDNLPCIRISESIMRMILWIMHQSGIHETPSLEKLHKFQKHLREESGNVFFMNDIRSLIAKDWADPDVQPHIHIYPEIPENGVVSEVFHAEKWRRDMDCHYLSPMFDSNGVHFYIDELSRLADGRLVIPLRWLTFQKRVYADAFLVTLSYNGEAVICENQSILIDASTLKSNYLDLQDYNEIPPWTCNIRMTACAETALQSGLPARMPNPDCVIAGGDPLYTSQVDFFCDDVSGNHSKEMTFKESHIHFTSTSQHASSTEQFYSLKKVIDMYGNAATSDNPAQSEQCSHAGSQSCHNCRKCNLGGEKKLLKTDDGYISLFKKGTSRSKEGVLSELQAQVAAATNGASAMHIQKMQTNSGIKDAYTQYWIDKLLEMYKSKVFQQPNQPKSEIVQELKVFMDAIDQDKIYSGFLTLDGFDPTKDTPVEILHTILLGIVKYTWHHTHSNWSPAQKAVYALWLQSTDENALSIQSICANYIMQYANSLIGRQLKTINQTSTFHVFGLVNDNVLAIWRSVGELSALLWYPEICNMDMYLEDVLVAAQNVLDSFSVVNPQRIVDKIKLHLLNHLGDDIQHFVPLVRVATERYEAWNAIFRSCLIFSNHLAPSRDIAWQLASQEGLRQCLSNGWWLASDGEWRQSSSQVRGFVHSQPILQRILGCDASILQGSVRLQATNCSSKQQERETKILENTKGKLALNSASYSMSENYFRGTQLISNSLDECPVGGWVAFKSPIDEKPGIGHINAIFEQVSGDKNRIALLQIFDLASNRHPMLGMPVLQQRHGEETFLIVSTKDILFLFNAQHDCQFAKCEVPGVHQRKQEHEDSDVQDAFIEHKPVDVYIINLHAFYNAHLIRELLPRTLTQPIPIFSAKYQVKKSKSESEAEARRAKKRKEQEEKDIGTTEFS
ncbi:hypothetical protein GYMLUDRAFT_77906 [Collybiopsis luxurians FD-317 M1]|uniref:Uncharacterized protein n=1 Tax=Collybiopsis luxurians FD-317 M1 TaxID=944289 RepID=A0A0D0BCL2_9AGAR|nr:hypothetical protein GYMLUDRAFT_77906 [Collybiopsis luxurians FD-317 M1]